MPPDDTRADGLTSPGGSAREVACVAHVHSTLSDGTATVAEIAAAAATAGADAVLLTDHDTLEAQRRGLDGMHGDVLVVVGVEISGKVGHLLACGLPDEIDHDGKTASQVWDAVRRAGGMGFAAHPWSEGSRMSRRIGRPHPWTDIEGCPGIGVELWSVVTDAAEAWRGPRDLLRFVRSPELAAPGPSPRALAAWDRLCAERRVPAIGGLDAHQTGIRAAGRVLSPMPHERYFRLLQTHALCRVAAGETVDEPVVLEALEEGRAFLARPWVGDAHGFRFWAETGDGVVDMGAEGAAAEAWTLRASVPSSTRLRLLHGGARVAETHGRELEYLASDPGPYRVEAWRQALGAERLWILSNPIYLR